MDEIKEVADIREERVTLRVANLSYCPNKHMVKEAFQYLRKKMDSANVGWIFPGLKDYYSVTSKDLALHRMNFNAYGGELVGIMGNVDERKELINILAGRTRAGEFDGNVSLSGPHISEHTYFYDKVAYVHSVSRL